MADGTNLTVSLGADGILLVDTGSPKMTDKILAAVAQLASAVAAPATNTCSAPIVPGGGDGPVRT